MNLICFTCGKYGHHKKNCSLTNLSKPREILEGARSSNNSDILASDKVILDSQQQAKDETFGSWMLVKRNMRNTRNNLGNKNYLKGEKETQRNKNDPHTYVTVNPKHVTVNGSKFATLDLEDVSTEDVAEGTPPREFKEDGLVPGLVNLDKGKEINVSNRESQQEVNINHHVIQQKISGSSKTGVNSNMLKSKSIMERLVKSKGGGESKSTGALKASSSGTFKTQKLKNPLHQWDKSKSLMIVEDLCRVDKSPNSLISAQGESGILNLKSKPPDPGIQTNEGTSR